MKSFVSKVLLPLLGGSATIAIAAGFLLGGHTFPSVTPAVADAPGTNSQPNPEGSGTATDSELDKEGTGTDSELNQEGTGTDSELNKKGGLSPKNPKDRPDPKNTQETYLNIQSNPPGARAEVGIQFNGWQIVPSTGRIICTTPCTKKLDPADVAILPNGIANLVIRLEKANFATHIDVIELGKLDRPWALEGGKTYSRSITLQSNDWVLKDSRAKDSKPDSSNSQEEQKPSDSQPDSEKPKKGLSK
jgi:hypothetical protein